MIFLRKFRCLLSQIFIFQLNLSYIKLSWLSFNTSDIFLLGLFQDFENTSVTNEFSIHANAMFKAAVILSQRYNITIDDQYIEWQSLQTDGNAINALSDVCETISFKNIYGIVGPALSREARQIAGFGERIGIPVISYSATDPALSDRNHYPAFYRTVPSDDIAALAIVQLFLRYNWTSCVIIYQNDAFGSDGAQVISNAFLDNDLTVFESIVFDISTRKIRGDLKSSLTNSVTRIVLLWAESYYSSIILQMALDSNVLGPQFTWILSSSVPLSSFDQTSYEKMIGILTVEPVTGSVVNIPTNLTLLNAAFDIWKQYEPESFPGSINVSSYGLFAFDATWTLIQSLQQLCSIPENSSCLTLTNSSFCFDRHFISSELLFKTINSIDFLGVSGPVRFSTNTTDRITGLYYYVRNIQLVSNQLTYIPVLKYVEFDSWEIYSDESVIVWPGNSLISPSNIALLDGVTLRIGVIESSPFTVVSYVANATGQDTIVFTGYIPDLIELLRSQMNFIPDIQLAPSNQTYSEIVAAVANGDYDIVVGDVTVTSARREIVDFSNSIFDTSIRIIVRKSSTPDVDLLSYLNPFTRNLWLLVLAACSCASLLIYLFERSRNDALANQPIVSGIFLSLWFSIGTIMGYGVEFHAHTIAGRILTVGLYILSLVLVASYTANLASDLTILKSTYIIDGVDDLKNGKIPFNRIGILVGTSTEDYYLREISDGSRNFYPLTSTDQLYDSLFQGIIDVSIMDAGAAEYATNTIYCNLTVIGDDFDASIFGIVTPKQWIYAQSLDVNILSLREQGSLDTLRQKWFQTKLCPDTATTTNAMGIDSLSGLFLTFAAIAILALILFIWKKRFIMRKCRFIRLYRKKTNFVLNHQRKIHSSPYAPFTV